ncbi:MAG: glycoside hydrolase family 3 [Lachnospiraceae bacterium]|nr:glycoside hydrolase family 3 [Lachnospiraceae bacterium]
MSDENRENRRNRRKRERTAAIVLFTAFLVLVAMLVGFGIMKIRDAHLEKEQKEAQMQELAAKEAEREAQMQAAKEEQALKESEKEAEIIVSEDTLVTRQDQMDEITAIEEELFGSEAKNRANALIEEMTLRQKLCQMFIVTPEALTKSGVVTMCGPQTQKAFAERPVGGIIYFSQNLLSVDQTKGMLSNMQHMAVSENGIPLFLAVDEEGGKVARVADALNTTKFSPMFEYKSFGKDIATGNAKTIGADIKRLGFNLDFAPVADVWTNKDNTVIGERAYSDDFEAAAMLVAASVDGFHQAGMACCLKHFPGHGNTSQDSHNSFATTDRTLEQLRKEEYLPFISGIEAGADMVMVGHITVTAADKDPATLSKTMITDELRGTLGYEGLIVTDAMNMGAITNYYGGGEACVKAVLAGADIILMPSDFTKALDALENAVTTKRIPEERIDESVRRILIYKFEHLD